MLLLRRAQAAMVPHGWGKLERLRTGLAAGEVKFYDWMGLGTEMSLGLAVLGELVAPAFIVVGALRPVDVGTGKPPSRWRWLPLVRTQATPERQGARAAVPRAVCGARPDGGRALQPRPPDRTA